MRPVIAAALAYNREPVSLGQPPEIGLKPQRRKRRRARLDGSEQRAFAFVLTGVSPEPGWPGRVAKGANKRAMQVGL